MNNVVEEKFVSWSGGKDSSATIIICHELGYKNVTVIISEVMFDHSRNISGENPEHIKWIYETAIPTIQKQFGYKVIVLRDKSDYIHEFNRRIGTKTKIKSRIGKKAGWFIGGMCIGNDRLKMRPIRRFFKNIKTQYTQFVGIAYDEPERLVRLTKKNKRSLLAEQKITEAMTYDICRKYNLLSPIYEKRSRGGCWFCPNQSINEFAELNKEYPELWNELKVLSCDDEIVSKGFKYGKPFEEVEKQVILINNQLTLFNTIDSQICVKKIKRGEQ